MGKDDESCFKETVVLGLYGGQPRRQIASQTGQLVAGSSTSRSAECSVFAAPTTIAPNLIDPFEDAEFMLRDYDSLDELDFIDANQSAVHEPTSQLVPVHPPRLRGADFKTADSCLAARQRLVTVAKTTVKAGGGDAGDAGGSSRKRKEVTAKAEVELTKRRTQTAVRLIDRSKFDFQTNRLLEPGEEADFERDDSVDSGTSLFSSNSVSSSASDASRNKPQKGRRFVI
ncbi:unnamed protein product [Protopolystoma xenopodis]|uniref:Uncharacterized protein n=1 Tax=Protopolystoma xenopodis TaxID=117903 RepID=A0A3S5FEC1_9PLAT|nr:unnamed protein product [Protopolystoma xenopodis]